MVIQIHIIIKLQILLNWKSKFSRISSFNIISSSWFKILSIGVSTFNMCRFESDSNQPTNNVMNIWKMPSEKLNYFYY